MKYTIAYHRRAMNSDRYILVPEGGISGLVKLKSVDFSGKPLPDIYTHPKDIVATDLGHNLLVATLKAQAAEAGRKLPEIV
jgi:hypothetical protein